MPQLMDTVLNVFLAILATGRAALWPIGWGLLGFFALLMFYQELWPCMLSGGLYAGEALGTVFYILVRLGFFMYVLDNAEILSSALFELARQFGTQGGGSEAALELLVAPSSLLALQQEVTRPLEVFMTNLSVLNAWWAAPVALILWVVEILIYAVFVGLAVNLAFVQVEFYMAVLAATVFLPCALVPALRGLGDFCAGWVLGGVVRAFLVIAMASVAVPIVGALAVPAGSIAGDPTVTDALGLLGATVLYGIAAWHIPSRATHLVGTGLGLSGMMLAGAGSTLMRWGMIGRGVIQATSTGMSRLTRGRIS